MAVRKATRSIPPAQPNPKPARRRDPQLKADIFETLRNLNRGYGAALTALNRLHILDHRKTFPAGFLEGYSNRTEALRAQANRDLLRLIAGREEHEAERLDGLSAQNSNHKRAS